METNTTSQFSLDYTAFLANLEEKLANIEAERLTIEAKENALKESIASFRKLIAVESGEVVRPNQDDIVIPKRAFKGLTVTDSIEKYLKLAKQWRTVRQIVDGLRQGGIDSKSQHLVANVRTALKRQGPSRGIIHVGNQWGLAEWPHRPVQQESNNQKEMEISEQEESDPSLDV